jgi:hypothetical protein
MREADGGVRLKTNSTDNSEVLPLMYAPNDGFLWSSYPVAGFGSSSYPLFFKVIESHIFFATMSSPR